MTAPDAAGIETALAAGLAAHRLVISDFLSVIATCEAEECEWRWTGWRRDDAEEAHRAHQAAALLPVVTQAQAEALREFVQWVASNRAYNGSNYPHGQSLYNECLNAVLPAWAQEFARADESGA